MSADLEEVAANVDVKLQERAVAIQKAAEGNAVAEHASQPIKLENVLLVAVKNGTEEGVRGILEIEEMRQEIDTPDEHGLPAIIWAALLGYGAIVDILKKAGASTDLVTHLFPIPNTALVDNIVMFAVRKNFINGIRYMVATPEFRDLLNKVNAQGVVPIVLAVLLGRGEIVELLKPAATIDLETFDKFPPGEDNILMFSVRNKAVDGVQYLMTIPQFQAMVNKKIGDLTPYMLAAILGEEKMVEAMAPFSTVQLEDYRSAENESILIISIKNRLLAGMQFIATKYPSLVNEPDKQGMTPMMWAAVLGEGGMVDILKAAGATTNLAAHRFPNGDTLLIAATLNNLESGVEYLLKEETTRGLLNIRNTAQQSPVYIAFAKGFVKIAKMLKEAGADLSVLHGHTSSGPKNNLQAAPVAPDPNGPKSP